MLNQKNKKNMYTLVECDGFTAIIEFEGESGTETLRFERTIGRDEGMSAQSKGISELGADPAPPTPPSK